jgi:hypothetical protein
LSATQRARCATVNTPEGKPLVEGKKRDLFTDGEEEEAALTKVVPFLVEDELAAWVLPSRRSRTGA